MTNSMIATTPAGSGQDSLWDQVGTFELLMLATGAGLTVALAAFFIYLWLRGNRESPSDPDHG